MKKVTTNFEQVVWGVKYPAPEDQYHPTAPLYVEQEQEQEPDAEELPDQDLAAQKTEYEL